MSILQFHLQEGTHTFCPWRVEGIPHGVPSSGGDLQIRRLVGSKAGTRVEKGVTKRDSVERFSLELICCVSVTPLVICSTLISGGIRVRALQVHIISLGET